MRYWDISALEGLSAGPQILSTTDETRTIAIGLAAGEALSEHQVHERAWVVVISGRAHFADTEGTSVEAGPGFIFEFDPAEAEIPQSGIRWKPGVIRGWCFCSHPGPAKGIPGQ